MISGIMDTTNGFAERRNNGYTLPPPMDIPRIPSDGLSPSNTTVSSASTASSSSMNNYYSHVQGSWHTPGSNSYTFTSPPPQPSHPSYTKMYDTSSMGYDPRTSRSPGSSAENILPPPSYDATSQHHQSTTGQPTSTHSGPSASSYPRGLAPVHPSHQSQASLPTQPPILTSNASSSAPMSAGLSLDTYKTHSSFSPYSATSIQPSSVNTTSLPRGLPSVTHDGYPSMYSTIHHPMSRPVLSNMGHPGAPMSMMSNMPLNYMSPMGYMNHGQAPQERPFKCDQCPQSFNRNHDLKRHKRIHLSVKPYPCTFCDKSFSRKDALKRHRLVKGCGARSAQRDGVKKEEAPISSDQIQP